MIGQTLAHYRITAALGAGGMGEVYRATDTKLGRDVAIKILPGEVAKDPERLQRLQREAHLLASLNHPHIAAIYGLEEADGQPFLVLELVEGEDLAERLKRGAIPVDEALEIARQTAEALEEAHDQAIVHRDLKPANLKVTPAGKVKVLDFGLAKAYGTGSASDSSAGLSQSPTLVRSGTQEGVILGTAAYMSPEQAKGKPVDRRADTWAFGCVLYEMLTGARAFGGETVTEVLAAVVRDEPAWQRLPADVPAAVRDLLRRCLRKEVSQRLQAIGDARIGIEEVLAGSTALDGVAASPSPPSWRRALPWVAGLAAGVLISAVIFGGLPSRRSRPSAMHFRAVTNFAGVQAQPALSPDGRQVAFVSNRDGDYNIYVGLVSGGNLVQVTEGRHAKARPCWSPDGATIAYARLNDGGLWDIWQVPALGGTPRRLIRRAADPAWSRDGQWLAYANLATGTVWVSDPEGQNTRPLTPVGPTGYGPDGWPTGYGFHDAEPRFSPNGRELAYVIRTAGPYGELMLLDLDSGQARQLTHDSALALSPAWSPDGLHVYFASSRGGALNVWKIATRGGDLEQITAGQGDDAQPDVSFDGSRLVFATYREHIGIAQMDLEAEPGTQSTRRLTIDPARNAFAPVYSPDGARIAYFSNYKGVENEAVWVADADGSDPVPLVQDARRVSVFPRWTPDSESLIFRSEPPTQVTDGDYRRVSLSGGTPETIVERAMDIFFDLGPGGRLLFKDAERNVASYDPATDETEVLATSPLSQEGGILRWSPDGRSVAYVVRASKENDPNAGLWVEDLGEPPRQIFPGWVCWYARGANGVIWLQEGRPDLNGVLWKVGWDGQGLARHSTIRRAHSYWNPPAGHAQSFFDVSPDGRHLAVDTQEVLQANIGMIDNVR